MKRVVCTTGAYLDFLEDFVKMSRKELTEKERESRVSYETAEMMLQYFANGLNYVDPVAELNSSKAPTTKFPKGLN